MPLQSMVAINLVFCQANASMFFFGGLKLSSIRRRIHKRYSSGARTRTRRVFFRGELGIRTVTYLVFTKARTNGECFVMDLNGRCLLLGTTNAVFIVFSAYRTKCSFMHGRCPLPRDHKSTSEVKCERDRRPFFPDE